MGKAPQRPVKTEMPSKEPPSTWFELDDLVEWFQFGQIQSNAIQYDPVHVISFHALLSISSCSFQI